MPSQLGESIDFGPLYAALAARGALIPNAAPGPNVINAEQLAAALQASSDAILEAIRASEARITAKMEEQSSLLILRLHNAKCPNGCQLLYPTGVNIQNLPQTKSELNQIEGPACVQIAEALGMPGFPDTMNVDGRREKIMHYLGAI